MARRIQRFFAGHVSKKVLLTMLLPLSIASFFITVIIAAYFFPLPYNWVRRPISNLSSPLYNPRDYWIPCLGVAVSAVLALPFAGYVAQRLRGITPRLARATGVAFALAFVLLLLADIAVTQQVRPLFGWDGMHEFLSRGAAAAFSIGMFCCCVCAFRDRFRVFGGQRSLGTALSYYWRWATLLPVGCAAIVGVLAFLDDQEGQAWAAHARGDFQAHKDVAPCFLGMDGFSDVLHVHGGHGAAVTRSNQGSRRYAASTARPAYRSESGEEGIGSPEKRRWAAKSTTLARVPAVAEWREAFWSAPFLSRFLGRRGVHVLHTPLTIPQRKFRDRIVRYCLRVNKRGGLSGVEIGINVV